MKRWEPAEEISDNKGDLPDKTLYNIGYKKTIKKFKEHETEPKAWGWLLALLRRRFGLLPPALIQRAETLDKADTRDKKVSEGSFNGTDNPLSWAGRCCSLRS